MKVLSFLALICLISLAAALPPDFPSFLLNKYNVKPDELLSPATLIVQTKSETNVELVAGDFLFKIRLDSWNFELSDMSVTPPVMLFQEAQEEAYRTNFGKFVGYEIPIYYGYFTRLGFVEYWRHATKVLTYSVSETEASFEVDTNDHRFKLLVKLFNFKRRQFDYSTSLVSKQGDHLNEINRMGMSFMAQEGEGFYGFGERFNMDNQRGHDLACWSEDGGWSLGVFQNVSSKYRFPTGETSTYIPMPYFVSSRGYGFEVETFYRTYFDVAKKRKDRVWFEVETNKFKFTFYGGRNPLETLYMFTEKYGRSLIPPKWSFGPWSQLNGEMPNVTRSAYEVAQIFLSLDIPVTHSINTLHFLPAHSEKGSEKAVLEQNQRMLSLGIKQSAYFNGYISKDLASDYYEFAKNKSFFIMDTKTNEPFEFQYFGTRMFHVSEIDFTNPEAVKWYQTLLQKAVDLGFYGWMYDYGEYTGSHTIAHDGTTGYEMHNKYPLVYQKACFDFLVEKREDKNPKNPYAPDYLHYVRSGYVGSQAYTWAQWTGDPSSDYSLGSGLGAQIPASLNLGLSGMPYSGSDVGGFEWWLAAAPDYELWCRWAQLGAMSGFFHDQTGGNGLGNKTHILDSKEGIRCWRRYSKLRTALFPYIYTMSHESHYLGLPLMRHHLLSYPNDPEAIKQTYQYMFGDSILVAPVIMPRVAHMTAYLPKGNDWYQIVVGKDLLFDEQDGRFRLSPNLPLVAGGAYQQLTNVTIDSLPLFVKPGSIIQTLDPSVFTIFTGDDSKVNKTIVTSERRKHMVHLWVFPNAIGYAKGYNYFDDLEFTLQDQTLSIRQDQSATPTVVIAQIVVSQKPTQVVANGSGELPVLPSWTELMNIQIDGQKSAWYFDAGKQGTGVLYVRLQPQDKTVKF